MPPPTVAFIVQAHEQTRQLDWLLQWLARSGSTTILSYDGAHPPRDAPGIVVVPSEPVCWGGYSQVSAFLAALDVALAAAPWDYLVNLSGTCFPAKPFAALAGHLALLAADRASLVQGQATGPPALRPATGFRQPQYLGSPMLRARGVTLLCEAAIVDRFQTPRTSPVYDIRDRLNYHVEEIPSQRTLLVRSLTAAEARSRATLLAAVPLHFGRAWYCLHRGLAETIARRAAASRTMVMLRHAFEPDELFLPTLVHGEGVAGAVRVGTLHGNGGEATEIGAAGWRAVHAGADFFVRKVEGRRFESVLAAAQGRI